MARNYNQNRNRNRRKRKTTPIKINYPTTVTYYEGITVGALAKRLERKAADIIKVLFKMGMMVTINDALSEDVIQLIALELGVSAT